MGILSTMRAILLAVVVLFSFIVLALAAHLTSVMDVFVDKYYSNSFALAIAVSVITILTINLLLIIDCIRIDATTSKIIAELIVLGLLGILWLATSTDTTSHGNAKTCTLFGYAPQAECHEISALEAFSFLNWLILLGYTIALFVLSVVAGTRGNIVWNSSVKEANFSAPATVPSRDGVSQPQTQQTLHTGPIQTYLPFQPQLSGGYGAGKPPTSYNVPNQGPHTV